MTVDPSSLLTISIGTIVSVLAVVVAVTATGTRLRVQIEALIVAVRELKSWHLRATESARDDLDDAVETFRQRHHVINTRHQTMELRLHVLEHAAGIPRTISPDLTPVESVPITGRFRRAHQSADPTPDPR